jgi:hypothetical protein
LRREEPCQDHLGGIPPDDAVEVLVDLSTCKFSLTWNVSMNPTGFDRVLQWSDFAGSPDPSVLDEDAYAETDFSFQANQTAVTGAIDINRSRSWVRPGQMTDSLLLHEQGHYDIDALALRDFVNQAKVSDNKGQNALWASFFGPDGRSGRSVALENLYDSSTNHSQNRARQDQWIKKIRELKRRTDGTFAELERWALTIG